MMHLKASQRACNWSSVAQGPDIIQDVVTQMLWVDSLRPLSPLTDYRPELCLLVCCSCMNADVLPIFCRLEPLVVFSRHVNLKFILSLRP